MTKQEFKRLRAFDYAKRNAPQCWKVSKRSAKGQGRDVGKWMKGGCIHDMCGRMLSN